MSAVFDPHDLHDLDPDGDHEASDTFDWFVARVEAEDPDALDLTTPAKARALYVAVCAFAAEVELVASDEHGPLPGPRPAQVHLLEVAARDPDGNPTGTVERGVYDWPFGAFPDCGETFVLAGRLWGLERRVWFPDTAVVGMFVVDQKASEDALVGIGGATDG